MPNIPENEINQIKKYSDENGNHKTKLLILEAQFEITEATLQELKKGIEKLSNKLDETQKNTTASFEKITNKIESVHEKAENNYDNLTNKLEDYHNSVLKEEVGIEKIKFKQKIIFAGITPVVLALLGGLIKVLFFS